MYVLQRRWRRPSSTSTALPSRTVDVNIWNPAGHPPHEAEAGKGANAFVMKEVSDCCQRQFCGHRRTFSIAMVPASPLIGTCEWRAPLLSPGCVSEARLLLSPCRPPGPGVARLE